jgi:hypothetical protein
MMNFFKIMMLVSLLFTDAKSQSVVWGFNGTLWPSVIQSGVYPVYLTITYGNGLTNTNYQASEFGCGQSFISQGYTTTFSRQHFFSFMIRPSIGYTMNLSNLVLIARSSETGPRTFEVRSEQDNYTATLGSGTMSGTSCAAYTIPLTGVIRFTDYTRFIIYFYNASSTTGTLQIDELTTNSSVLGVEYQSIKATATGNTNTLAWQVANEINITGYQVERSTDNNNWEIIGKVAANKATTYTFEDKTPLSISYYRIRSEELDGTKGQVTKVVTVQRNGKKSSLKVYPQPTITDATVAFNSNRTSIADMVLMDISGKIIRHQNINIVEGENQIHLNTEGVTKGIYLLKIKATDWQETVKFVKL